MNRLPFLPTRDLVLFPSNVSPIYVGREKSIKTLDEALKTNNRLILSSQKNSLEENPNLPNGVYKIGVIATVIQSISLPNNNLKGYI